MQRLVDAAEARDAPSVVAAAGGDRLARLALERAGVLSPDGGVATSALLALARTDVLVRLRGEPADEWAPVMTVPDYMRTRLSAGAVTETFSFWYSTLEAARSRAVMAVPYLDEGFETLVPALGRLGRRGGTALLLTRGLHFDRSERNVAVIGSIRSVMPVGSIEVLSWEDGGLGLHAKALIVDSIIGYVGSANFTWAGMNAQAELGVEVRGPSVMRLEYLLGQLAAELRARKAPHGR
jgi:hypothetical protein